MMRHEQAAPNLATVHGRTIFTGRASLLHSSGDDENEKEQRLMDAVGAIPGVRRTRIEWGDSGPLAVKVLVTKGTSTSSVHDEVQRRLGELGHTLHSERVEILGLRPLGADDFGRRARLTGLVTERHDDHFRARVTLELKGEFLVGESGGPVRRHFERSCVARATCRSALKALRVEAEIHSAEVVPIGGQRVALVLLSGEGDILEGSALVKSDDHDAIARATLRALNRMAFDD